MRTFIMQNRKHSLLISKIILGTTHLGNIPDVQEAFQQLDAYYEMGGRCIDTARCYSNLAPDDLRPSEEVIGEWLKKTGVRDKMVISTKGGHPPYGKMNLSRLDAGSLRYDLEKSLAALQTECIDVYWLHRDDHTMPVSEIITTMNEFVAEGKIKCFGASNWQTERIIAANTFARNHDMIGMSGGQIQWSLAACTPKSFGDKTLVCMNDKLYRDYFDMDFPLMAYNAQAKGFFSKLAELKDETKLSDKIRARYLDDDNREVNLKRFKKVMELAKKYDASPAVIALTYLTSSPLKCGAVIGCSSLSQLADSMSAQDFALTDEEITWLEN